MSKMNKRSQLKIQQMAFMLMAVFLFFVLVGLFWLMLSSQSMKKEVNLLAKNDAIEHARMLASSPEFTCGDYCIDADRVLVLLNRTVYKNFWNVESIEIRTVYPENTQEVPCTMVNFDSCNYLNVYNKRQDEQASKVSSYVSLCKRTREGDYIYNKCQLAKIIIGYKVVS